MDPKLVEKLHEKASNAYLQGDVDEALSAWRQVLQADPTDERALEGVRLCEGMTGCESASVVTDGQSPFAVGSAPAESDPSDGDLSDPLDKLLDMGTPPSPPPPPSSDEAEQTAADEEGGVLDFSDLVDDTSTSDERGVFDMDDLLSPPSGGLPAPDAETAHGSFLDDDVTSERSDDPPGTTWHFGIGPETPDPAPVKRRKESDLGDIEGISDPPSDEFTFGNPGTIPEPSGENSRIGAPSEDLDGEDEGPLVDPPPEVSPGDVLAAGLHRRASDLLATALAEMERGDRELALTTLERLLILDEDNEAARSLRQKLLAEIEGSVPEAEGASGTFERFELEDDADDALELNLGAATKGKAVAKENAETTAKAVKDVASPTPFELPVAEDTEPPAEVAAAAPTRRRFHLPSPPVSKKIWIPAAAVIVLGLGFALRSTVFGGGGATENLTAPAPRAETKKPEKKPKPVENPVPANNEAGQPEEPVAEAGPEEQLARALQQADTAMAEADYAAAIVALNAALKLDPENPVLVNRLKEAGESYHIQQQKQERWNRAVQDFDQGDYRAALAYFYRLPEEEQTESVERYIRNGWYNLGLMALKSRDCSSAMEHFKEARRVDAGDSGVLEASDLAVRCDREGSDVIRESVLALQFRGLEDAP